MTTPSGEFPWEAANATDGLAWYAGQGIGDWKARMAENVFKSFLSVGLFALRVPFTDDLADAVIGPEAELDGEIPSLEQVSNFIQGKWDLLDDISGAVQPIIDVFTAVLKAFGGDFSGLADLPRVLLDRLASLFGGAAGLPVDDVFSGLESMFSGLFSNGGLDASKLIGDLPSTIVDGLRGLLTAALSLAGLRITPNMIFGGDSDVLVPGGFDSAASMVESADWHWDGTVGHSSSPLGSARATANGNRLVQLSERVVVEPGQKLPVSAWVSWSGVSAGTGAGMSVEAQFYSGSTAGAVVTVGSIPSPAGSSGWVQRSGTVTVPAGVDGMRVRIAVESIVTAGSVWFDDVEIRRTGTMPQDFITNLIPDLANLNGFVQNVIDNIMNGFGLAGSGFSLSHLLTQFGTVFTSSSSIPQANISGLTTALGNLLSLGTWNQFLSGFTAAGNNGTAPSTGIPALDGLINSFLGVRSTATSTQAAVQAQAVTSGVQNGMAFVRTVFTSSGTWTPSAIPSGYTQRVKVTAACINGGNGGKVCTVSGQSYTWYDGTSNRSQTVFATTVPPDTALGGGYVAQDFTIAQAGSSQSITVGAGGASNAAGGVSRFGASLLAGVNGTSRIPTSMGAVASTCAPGNGGQMGTGSAWPDNSSYSQSAQGGGAGQPSGLAAGGNGGSPGGTGSAGAAGGSDSAGFLYYGGGGGGGGGIATNATRGNGGNGGAPGGAGGSGSTGGSGAQGAVIVWEWFA